MDDRRGLSDEEIKILKEMVEQEKNYRWLRSWIRSVASWVAIVISAIALLWDKIKIWISS